MVAKTYALLAYEDIGVRLLDLDTRLVTQHVGDPVGTDDIEETLTDGTYVWIHDFDNTIAVYTADLVFLAAVDAGYYAKMIYSSGKTMHVVGDFLYTLTSLDHDNLATASNKNQWAVRKFNKVTLAQVGEYPIADAELWDSVNFLATIDTAGGVVWGDDFVWLRSSTVASHYKKISLVDGTTVDVWNTGPADAVVAYRNNLGYNTGVKRLFGTPPAGTSTGTFTIVDFDLKTISAPVSFNSTAAAVAAGGMWDEVTIWPNFPMNLGPEKIASFDWAGNTVKFIVDWDRNDSVTQGTVVEYKKLVEVTIDLLTGAVTFSPNVVSTEGLLAHDSLAKSSVLAGSPASYWMYYGNAVCLADGRWLITDERKGFAIFDFTAGTVTNTTGASFMHGYSNDSAYLEAVRLMTVDQTTITGTVTQSGANAVARPVYLFDELTGVQIDSTVTNGSGVYSLKKNTARKAFVVAAGASDAENFKINSHL